MVQFEYLACFILISIITTIDQKVNSFINIINLKRDNYCTVIEVDHIISHLETSSNLNQFKGKYLGYNLKDIAMESANT